MAGFEKSGYPEEERGALFPPPEMLNLTLEAASAKEGYPLDSGGPDATGLVAKRAPVDFTPAEGAKAEAEATMQARATTEEDFILLFFSFHNKKV